MKNRFSWTAEYVIQVGTQGENNHTSMGGYAYASYLINQKPNTVFSTVINYLSGDNPDTETNENWNPIFSRWPKWSELYVYSQIQKTGKKAYRTNTISPYIKLPVSPSKKLSITGTYYMLMAEYPRTYVVSEFEEDTITTGKKRGNEIQLLANFVINKYLTGHFRYDSFSPSDFYPAPRTGGPFIRGELMFKL